MRNDDFMYTRQEEPRQAFMTTLQARLQEKEEKPVSSSFSLNRSLQIVASIVMLCAVLLLASSDVRAFVMQTLQIDGWIAVSEQDAQAYFPFAVPQEIPDGYERQIVWTDQDGNSNIGDVSLNALDVGDVITFGHIVWRNEVDNCWMMMTILENRNSPEIQARSLQQAEDFASRYDWIDVFDVDGVRAIWRVKTRSGGINDMEIEWVSNDNIVHRLETSSDCMTQEDFTAIAQSVE
ncbi:MAG: hypothetical protein WBC91_12915 [Phototrophicaceae bacterium]